MNTYACLQVREEGNQMNMGDEISSAKEGLEKPYIVRNGMCGGLHRVR